MSEKKDIRLIALDLDGTTFNSEKQLTKKTLEAIEAAMKKGVIVMPATGRPKVGLPENILAVPGIRYALTSNGAVVLDLETGEKIIEEYIEYNAACRIVEKLLKEDSMVDIYENGVCLADSEGYDRLMNTFPNIPEWYRQYIIRTRVKVDDIAGMTRSGEYKLEKILASFRDMERLGQLKEEIAKTEPSVAVSSGLPFNIEVNAAAATKGKSILRFAERMGITRSQVMACGDATNDYSMLAEAGFAVAMANAVPEIKAIADYVTLSNDEDGVAVAIEKFVL